MLQRRIRVGGELEEAEKSGEQVGKHLSVQCHVNLFAQLHVANKILGEMCAEASNRTAGRGQESAMKDIQK